MPATARIFVSHTRQDVAWCRAFVEALRWGGADIWYAEHLASPGQVAAPDEIEREVRNRGVFIAVLSPAALVAEPTKRDIGLALQLAIADPGRPLLAVMAEQCALPPSLQQFTCLTGPEGTGITPTEAAARVQEALQSAPAVQAADAGTALLTPAHATQRVQRLRAAGRYDDALAACDLALGMDPLYAPAWCARGDVLRELKRYNEAVTAYDHAVSNDVLLAAAWYGKAQALNKLKLRNEALAAYERVLGLEPSWVQAWIDKGDVLVHLQQYEEAVAAYERALAHEPTLARVWNRIGNAYQFWAERDEATATASAEREPRHARTHDKRDGMKFGSFRHYEEALAAYDRALTLDPAYANGWSNKIHLLEKLGRQREALAARRARERATRDS